MYMVEKKKTDYVYVEKMEKKEGSTDEYPKMRTQQKDFVKRKNRVVQEKLRIFVIRLESIKNTDVDNVNYVYFLKCPTWTLIKDYYSKSRI